MAGGVRFMRATKNLRWNDTRHKPIYTAVGSELRLPTDCDCIPCDGYYSGNYNGAYPEFFHGFYSGNYGLDIGILYIGSNDGLSKKFRLFYHTLSNTAYTTDNIVDLYEDVDFGDTVMLLSYLDHNGLVTEVKRNGRKIGQIKVNLTSSAYKKFKTGCWINRELNIAANRDNYLNKHKYRVYFDNASFVESTLTATQKINGSYYVAWDDTFGDLIKELEGGRNGLEPYEDLNDVIDKSYSRVINGFVKDFVSMNLRSK
ncbi:hypothetical protein [Anaerophilus nitritogenes]|uniref:hypothetical protein n=1 Tax=Anaerophilus nitritogenes TaxID=2498136 RepID=UPI00101DD37C|nr:hypothetical protein [Anaerophilus nitritogenes]